MLWGGIRGGQHLEDLSCFVFGFCSKEKQNILGKKWI